MSRARLDCSGSDLLESVSDGSTTTLSILLISYKAPSEALRTLVHETTDVMRWQRAKIAETLFEEPGIAR